MFIRPTSIIAYSLTETDLRQFTHTLNQERITDTDSMIPIMHKGQISQIHRKDLSDGMSPWSAYRRTWLTDFMVDHDYLCQGITWYREVDDDTGLLCAYYFRASQANLGEYDAMMKHYQTGISCVVHGRYVRLHSDTGMTQRGGTSDWQYILSRMLGMLLCYGSIQHTNSIVSSCKITVPITGYTRAQVTQVQHDCEVLRGEGLFVQWYIQGSGMKQTLELMINDPELLQLLLPHLQYIDYRITMTTFTTLQSRSEQVCAQGIDSNQYIAKPRTLD